MAYPQVSDGEVLQIRRVAANILDKESRTADRRLALQLGGLKWG